MMSMYSLYRAWLLRENSSIASNSLSMPPDLLITVFTSEHQPYQFVAHRTVVSNHSGYLKSLIQNQEQQLINKSTHSVNDEQMNGSSIPSLVNDGLMNGSTNYSNTYRSNESSQYQMVGSNSIEIFVPSTVPLSTFSPLLTFMYTGFLDLTLSNIYDTLLAANILHMPHALDLCRSFLLHNVHSVANFTFNRPALVGPNLIKPIPERNLPNFFNTKIIDDTLRTGEESLKCASRPADLTTTSAMTCPSRSISQQQGSTSSLLKPNKKNRYKSDRKRRKSKLIRAHSSIESDSSDDVTVVITEIKKGVPNDCGTNDNLSTVFDIASCDGPVHFHKVLNEHYVYKTAEKNQQGEVSTGSLPTNGSDDEEINIDDISSDTENPANDNEENRQRNLVTENSFRASFRNQIQNQQIENIDKGNNGGAEYKCSMCLLGFKNQNGYDRHRILVHKSSNVSQVRSTHSRRIIPKTILKQTNSTSSNSKREVRLLDMNVQYYPCKTCGAKFPSYYFVHKHRRQCHPEEEMVVTSSTNNINVDEGHAIEPGQE